MKTNTVLRIIFILFSCNSVIAQNDKLLDHQEVRLNSSIFLQPSNNNNYLDFGAGVYQRIQILDYFIPIIGLEYNYIQTYKFIPSSSFLYMNSNDVTIGEILTRSQNISLPIELRYTIGERIKPFVGIGFRFDLFRYTEVYTHLWGVKYDGNIANPYDEKSYNIHRYRSNDFTLQLGLTTPTKKSELIYQATLRIPEYKDGTFHNAIFRLGFGVRF